jgi:hypothetical protein
MVRNCVSWNICRDILRGEIKIGTSLGTWGSLHRFGIIKCRSCQCLSSIGRDKAIVLCMSRNGRVWLVNSRTSSCRFRLREQRLDIHVGRECSATGESVSIFEICCRNGQTAMHVALCIGGGGAVHPTRQRRAT